MTSSPVPPLPTAADVSSSRLTVPSVLSGLRLLASPLLVALAWWDLPGWCVALAVVLLLLDWLDGKLAILLRQQTTFGARLDSAADAVLYACVLVAVGVARGDVVVREAAWIAVAVGTYALSVTAALVKFGRLPSYHNRLAKISWLLMVVAVVAVFADWSPWAVRVAMSGVTLANLEAIAITFVLREWRVNVPSVFHARRPGPP